MGTQRQLGYVLFSVRTARLRRPCDTLLLHTVQYAPHSCTLSIRIYIHCNVSTKSNMQEKKSKNNNTRTVCGCLLWMWMPITRTMLPIYIIAPKPTNQRILSHSKRTKTDQPHLPPPVHPICTISRPEKEHRNKRLTNVVRMRLPCSSRSRLSSRHRHHNHHHFHHHQPPTF